MVMGELLALRGRNLSPEEQAERRAEQVVKSVLKETLPVNPNRLGKGQMYYAKRVAGLWYVRPVHKFPYQAIDGILRIDTPYGELYPEVYRWSVTKGSYADHVMKKLNAALTKAGFPPEEGLPAERKVGPSYGSSRHVRELVIGNHVIRSTIAPKPEKRKGGMREISFRLTVGTQESLK